MIFFAERVRNKSIEKKKANKQTKKTIMPPNIKPLKISPPALVVATRTARRTMVCLDWAFNGCKVQPVFQFSPALRE